MTPTTPQLRAGFTLITAISEAIRQASEIPSGTLYAALMNRVDLEGYERILGMLKRAGLIEVTAGGLVRWVGREIED